MTQIDKIGLIYLRQSPNWKSLDESYLVETEKFDQLIGRPLGFTRSFIELWDRTFSIPYFQVRAMIKEITLANFRATLNCQIINSEPDVIKQGQSCLVTFSDDDDWLHPNWFKEVEGQIKDQTLIRWTNAKYSGDLEIRDDSRLFSYTNSYAIVWPDCQSDFTNFIQHWRANEIFAEKKNSQLFVDKILSITNKHPASTTEIFKALENRPGRLGLASLVDGYREKYKTNQFGSSLDWARPYQKKMTEIFDSITLKGVSRANDKNKQFLVSIIIPCFNDGDYLQEALINLEEVENIDYEIVIVDDGSTDIKTLSILANLDKDKYKIIRQKNQGPSAARNAGIRHSQGKYLLPLDSDNLIKPEYIYRSLEVLENDHSVDIVYGDRQEFGLENRVVEQPEFDIQKIILGNYIDTCALYRREVWEKTGGYDEAMLGWEDWEFWISAYKQGCGFKHLPEPLFYYRKKNKSFNSPFTLPEKRQGKIKYVYAKHADLINQLFAELISKNCQLTDDLLRSEEEKQRKSQIINQQVIKLTNFEKSLAWKLTQGIDKWVNFVLAPDGFIRFRYRLFIGWLQRQFGK